MFCKFDDTILLMPRFSPVNLRYEQQLCELLNVSETLTASTEDTFVAIDRSCLTDLNNKTIDLRQSQQVYLGKDGVGIGELPETMGVLADGTWFRDHLMRISDPNCTSLIVRPNVWIKNSRGSWFLPGREPLSTDISNIGLFDPFEMRVVELEEPEYQSRWDKVTSWMLDTLDETGDVTHSTVCVLPVNPKEAVTDLEDNFGFGLDEISKTNFIKGTFDHLVEGDTGFRILFHNLNKKGVISHFLLYLASNDAQVIDLSARFNGFDEIEALPTKPETIDPKIIDRKLIEKLTRLAVASLSR
jgi:hypothetical protein